MLFIVSLKYVLRFQHRQALRKCGERLQSFSHEGFRTMLAAVEHYSQPKFGHFVGFSTIYTSFLFPAAYFKSMNTVRLFHYYLGFFYLFEC